MKTKHYVMSFTLFFALMACTLPGVSQPAALPTFDANAIPTLVALTADAAISQTAVAQSLVTPTPEGMTSITIEQAEDGTTQYNDHDGDFEVIFPVGWLAVRPNSDEFNITLASAGANNPMLQNQMTSDQAGYDPNHDRLYSYVLRPDIGKNSLFGFSKLVWDSNDTSAIDNDALGAVVQSLEASNAIPGFRADTAQVRENRNAVPLIEVGGRFTMSDGQGGTVPFYTTIIFFKPTPASLTRITFTFMQDHNEQISADVNSVIESIKMIEP